MRITPWILFLILPILLTSCRKETTKKSGKQELTVENYIPTRKQLQERMQWFENARFGMFIHWGVYSSLSGSWEGKHYQGYGEHIQRMAQIPVNEYREKVAGSFNPLKFDAEEWVRLAKDAGMAYVVFTAKHHDGFAMYNSQVSDYNVVKGTPFDRDPMKELEIACRKAGLKFGIYYSQAFDWEDKNAPGNDWDYNNPGGDKLIGGQNWWETEKSFIPKARKYVDKKVIPQLKEIISNYQPDLIWFDTPHKLPESENLRILATVREIAPHIIINGRAIEACGDYYSTQDRPVMFRNYNCYWEGIPTTNNSYAYNANDTLYKTASHFVRLLAKASAKGGNILMNIGPKGDGSIDNRDIRILSNIAKWWKINGEASIRGTHKSPLAPQSWGEVTQKGNTLYLHVFELPKDGKITVGGLMTPVVNATLLCNKINRLKTIRQEKDLVIEVPSGMAGTTNLVISLACENTPVGDPRQLFANNQPTNNLNAFDASLQGNISFGGESEKEMWIENWCNKEEDRVIWPVRTEQQKKYKVYINYAAPTPQKESLQTSKGASGIYMISFGEQLLFQKVSPGEVVKEYVGEVTLPKGEFDIILSAREIDGDELFRPRYIELRPI